MATATASSTSIARSSAITWVRNRYMDTPMVSAGFQVFVGGLLVFATGVAIGSG